MPAKLCEKAGLPRKTSHCLRITCASRLFQNSVEERIARDRTGHTSNALLKYQKPSNEQTMLASKVLSPVCNTKPKLDVSSAGNLHGNLPVVESLGGVHERTTAKNESFVFSDCFDDFDCDKSDDILASIDLPPSLPSCPISSESTSSVMENVASYGTLNNCTSLTLL